MFKVMSDLSKQLKQIKSDVKNIRSFDADKGIVEVKYVLKSIVNLLNDIIKETEHQKTVDGNVIQ